MIASRSPGLTNRTALVIALTSFLGIAACDFSDPSRADVEPLVVRRASKDDVASKLGPGFTWYEPGENGDLTEFLSREPVDRYKPVREAVREGRRVMFYTTMWQQTWLFFDESDRLVGYWFSTQ